MAWCLPWRQSAISRCFAVLNYYSNNVILQSLNSRNYDLNSNDQTQFNPFSPENTPPETMVTMVEGGKSIQFGICTPNPCIVHDPMTHVQTSFSMLPWSIAGQGDTRAGSRKFQGLLTTSPFSPFSGRARLKGLKWFKTQQDWIIIFLDLAMDHSLAFIGYEFSTGNDVEFFFSKATVLGISIHLHPSRGLSPANCDLWTPFPRWRLGDVRKEQGGQIFLEDI